MAVTDDAPAVAPRRNRRRWVLLSAGVGAVLGAFVLVWFQPQKLWIDERVDEAIPTAERPADGTEAPNDASTTTTASPDPVEHARGELISLDHSTTGVVRVLELADGRRIVRLEGLDTSNGPDLYLYLTANPADGPEDAFDDTYVNLGRLKGNQGDQNYDLPADTELDGIPTVVIWCDRFNSAFGAADLSLT